MYVQPYVQPYVPPYALSADPSLPVKSVRELIAYARVRPGTLKWGRSYALFAPAGKPEECLAIFARELARMEKFSRTSGVKL